MSDSSADSSSGSELMERKETGCPHMKDRDMIDMVCNVQLEHIQYKQLIMFLGETI